MSPKREFSLGVDLAQHSFQVALAPLDADPEHWRDLANTSIAYRPDSPEGIERLSVWVEQHARGRRCRVVVVEATGKISARFARALADSGLPAPSIVNPRRTKAWADSLGMVDKTDHNDAAMLALYGVALRPRPTQAPRRSEAELRELSRLRQTYCEALTAWRNRRAEAEGPVARALIEQTIEELQTKIEQIERTCEQQVAEDATLAFQYQALQQIKGIKKITALTLTAEFGDLRRYGRNQLVARAGLYPKHYVSGSSVRRAPRLARGGGGQVRRVLYMGAMSLFHSKGAMREWIEERRARGVKEAKILGAVMRKLLLIARALMKNNGLYEEPKIGVHRQKVLA